MDDITKKRIEKRIDEINDRWEKLDVFKSWNRKERLQIEQDMMFLLVLAKEASKTNE